MKNTFYILLLAGISGTAAAQTDTNATTRNALFRSGAATFGLKAGYTQSGIYGNDINYIFADNTTRNLTSLHAGITVNSTTGKYFWLKHEMLVIQKGAGVNLYDSSNGNYSSTLKMLSLNIFPVSPCFHLKGFQLYAGPYVSALLNARLTRKDNNGKKYQDHSVFGDAGQFENQSKYLQKFDFGLNAGAEYQFPFGFFIGIKYTQGLTDIFQYANSYVFNDPKRNISIYNHAFLISAGYSFVKRRNK